MFAHSNSTPTYIPHRNARVYWPKDMQENVLSRNSDWETTQMPVKSRTDKHTVVYSYRATRYNMNGSSEHKVEGKKSDTKEHLLCDSIYTKFRNTQHKSVA